MKHLGEVRIMELALEPSAQKSMEEASHLAECEDCSAALRSERELTSALMSMQPRPVPDNFKASTTAKFAHATSIKVVLKPSIVIGLLLAGLIASAMLWLVIINPATFTTNAAMAFAKTVTFFKAMYVVLQRVPYATETLTSTTGAMVLMSAGLLAMLSKKTQAVK